MKEISIRALLDEQRLANLNRYQKLEELANLQRPNRYDQLTNTSLESYQYLRLAGFSSDSLVDQLTEEQIKRLAKALKLDASRVFLKEDINLLFFHLGSDLYFLVSTYESWVPSLRKILYWPFATLLQGVISYAIGLVSFFFWVWILPKGSLWLGVCLCIFYYGISIMAMCVSLLRRRDYPNSFPQWLNRIIYRVLPY